MCRVLLPISSALSSRRPVRIVWDAHPASCPVDSSLVTAQNSPFRINIHDLTNRPGQMREHRTIASAPQQWGAGLVVVQQGAEVAVSLRCESVHEGILVTAEVGTTATGECGRCLTEIALPLRVEFQELFAYHSGEAVECEVHGDHVDCETLVRDAIVLALPFQPVCQPDCLGLDPETGQRREPHHVSAVQHDPRWDALSGFAASPDQEKER